MKRWIIALAFLSGSTAASEAQSWMGKASYYGYHGRTANGGRVGQFTAAHRSLPFGSRVRVTNLGNHRSIVLVINDRGPFVRGRVIDVSTFAAERLGFRSAGIVRVRVEALR